MLIFLADRIYTHLAQLQENGPSNPGRSDDHLRTLKIVKLPLDHTDDDISTNMGSGRKGGRSWKYNRYNV